MHFRRLLVGIALVMAGSLALATDPDFVNPGSYTWRDASGHSQPAHAFGPPENSVVVDADASHPGQIWEPSVSGNDGEYRRRTLTDPETVDYVTTTPQDDGDYKVEATEKPKEELDDPDEQEGEPL